MKYLASVEVDQRQRLIHSADKFREMLGGSWSIEDTVQEAKRAIAGLKSVRIVMPVSGVVWFDSPDLEELGKCLTNLRRTLTVEAGLPCSFSIVGYDPPGYARAIEELDAASRESKDAKSGESGQCALPLFVPCSIQPGSVANLWRPGWKDHPQHHRRAMVSMDSDAREVRARTALPHKLRKFDSFQKLVDDHRDAIPYEFSDLKVPGSGDSYIGLIKADGDGTGRVLATLDWSKLASSLSVWPHQTDRLAFERQYWALPLYGQPWEPEQATCVFSWELNRCLMQSLEWAVDAVVDDLISAGNIPPKFPVAPVVAAGEDFWILCRRDLALDLALRFGKEYAQRAKDSFILQAALESAGILDKESFTLSFGVLFAREGYPFEIQLELAEELLNNAKGLRREGQLQEGCIDYHWLDATARESVKGARTSGYEYVDGETRYRLYTRPWPLSTASKRWATADEVGGELPSRKWHQLDMVLRQGTGLSELAYRDWWAHLSPTERCAVEKARADLGEGQPWSPSHVTGLRELYELYETKRGVFDEQD